MTQRRSTPSGSLGQAHRGVSASGGRLTIHYGLEARPDVLTFTSDLQAADLEVIGPVRVQLYVQASVPHIDLHARLCDVTRRGRSINLSDGILRLTDAAPDTPHPVEFDLWPIAHTFRRGHQIRLQVSGGAHPATDATTAPENHSPPAHAYRPATAPCSTTPTTHPQCGYPCTADPQVACRRVFEAGKAREIPCFRDPPEAEALLAAATGTYLDQLRVSLTKFEVRCATHLSRQIALL